MTYLKYEIIIWNCLTHSLIIVRNKKQIILQMKLKDDGVTSNVGWSNRGSNHQVSFCFIIPYYLKLKITNATRNNEKNVRVFFFWYQNQVWMGSIYFDVFLPTLTLILYLKTSNTTNEMLKACILPPKSKGCRPMCKHNWDMVQKTQPAFKMFFTPHNIINLQKQHNWRIQLNCLN